MVIYIFAIPTALNKWYKANMINKLGLIALRTNDEHRARVYATACLQINGTRCQCRTYTTPSLNLGRY